MGEKGLGTDPGVVGGSVPGGAIISARGAGGLGSSSPTGSSADRGTGEDTWEPSAGARQTPSRDFGDRMEGLGTDPGVAAADVDADGMADRGTGVPDASAVGGSVPAGKTMGHDSWDPGVGVGKLPSNAGGLAGKSASLTVSASPGGTSAGRGISSPTGSSADRGVETPDPGTVQYRESDLE